MCDLAVVRAPYDRGRDREPSGLDDVEIAGKRDFKALEVPERGVTDPQSIKHGQRGLSERYEPSPKGLR